MLIFGAVILSLIEKLLIIPLTAKKYSVRKFVNNSITVGLKTAKDNFDYVKLNSA